MYWKSVRKSRNELIRQERFNKISLSQYRNFTFAHQKQVYIDIFVNYDKIK